MALPDTKKLLRLGRGGRKDSQAIAGINNVVSAKMPAAQSAPRRKSRNCAPDETIARLERALAKFQRQGALQDNLRAQAVLEAVSMVSCAILIANNHGRYVTVNDDAVALTGYARSQLLRMSVWDITPGARAAQGRALWREFIEKGRMRGVYEIRRKDGEHVRAEYVALANVVRGLHVSALVPVPERRTTAPTKRSDRLR